jgi:hypothetical protein
MRLVEKFRKILAYIAHLALKSFGTRFPFRVSGEYRAIFLQCRATRGAIGHNGFHIVALKNLNIMPGLLFHEIHAAIAARRHAAAFDFLRRNYRAAIKPERAMRLRFSKEKALGTAEEETDAMARSPRAPISGKCAWPAAATAASLVADLFGQPA